ncbi:MAG: acyloxyacyl hydrolase [Chlorobia bacterium]|nr:acyloxyacyl hydrolase [Fimbriimonadaceae bacterium]
MNLRSLLLAGGIATTALTLADDTEAKVRRLVAPSYYFNLYGGQSMTILGSEDRRTGFGVGLGYGRPEPRFAFKGVGAQLVGELYYDHSSSRGASGQGPNQSESLGILVYAQYRWPKKRGLGLYASAGWGIQYTNQTSVDLDSKINSTPMIGLGVSWDTGEGEASIGLRFLHISNGGLVGNNQGQNQLFLVYSWKF